MMTEGRWGRGRESARTKTYGIGTSVYITAKTTHIQFGTQVCDSVRNASQTCQPHTFSASPQLLQS